MPPTKAPTTNRAWTLESGEFEAPRFSQPMPSAWKRALLLLSIAFCFWLAYRLQRASGLPKVHSAKRILLDAAIHNTHANSPQFVQGAYDTHLIHDTPGWFFPPIPWSSFVGVSHCFSSGILTSLRCCSQDASILLVRRRKADNLIDPVHGGTSLKAMFIICWLTAFVLGSCSALEPRRSRVYKTVSAYFQARDFSLHTMQGITILPANLATLVLESVLYGLLVLLFISTVYFLSTRRTFARQTAKHHLTSLVFLTITALFVVVTVHWSIVVYQAFFAFIHLGNAVGEDAFYADLAQPAEVVKVSFFFIAVLLGDALVVSPTYLVAVMNGMKLMIITWVVQTYRLWIIWERKTKVIIFPIVALIVLAVSCAVLLTKVATWESSLRGAGFDNESVPWETTGSLLSLLANLYSTGFIAFRMWRVTKVASSSKSNLTWFFSIVIESAALQTFWLLICIATALLKSDALFIALDNFPVIIAISNTLIHARVGLGWSQDSTGAQMQRSSGKSGVNAVWYVTLGAVRVELNEAILRRFSEAILKNDLHHNRATIIQNR
ncbi:hypothetical protein MSAN_01127300 [Mycena sanguinolenta]|uniref:Uncharacterized protein n=1 Tax=Mycena sanguinolenta TaxID=230812 RepID=A0A8H7D6S6_9AGAR|nr:hypothetical protein MSAN_01127300 [Mycena sanguinolenta]